MGRIITRFFNETDSEYSSDEENSPLLYDSEDESENYFNNYIDITTNNVGNKNHTTFTITSDCINLNSKNILINGMSIESFLRHSRYNVLKNSMSEQNFKSKLK